MAKIGWLSDIHLNFLDEDRRGAFVRELGQEPVEGWLISGDIADGRTLREALGLFAELQEPVFFVLGNHDYYHSSFVKTAEIVRSAVEGSRDLHWLTETEMIWLTEDVALVGDDGWGDGRNGKPLSSSLTLNDWNYIDELSGLRRDDLVRRLNVLGDEAAMRLGPKLEEVASGLRTVVVVTHVPPFVESAMHAGRYPDPAEDALPWYTCKAVGDLLLRVAGERPGVDFQVYCGHVHGLGGTCQVLENLTVYTAGAEYYRPKVQRIIELGEG